MQDTQRELDNFAKLHAPRVKLSDERCIYLARKTEDHIPLDVHLEPFTLEDITAQLDVNTRPVQWLIRQLQTYDVQKQVALGILYTKGEVFAHVVQKSL